MARVTAVFCLPNGLIDELNKHLRRFRRWHPHGISFELKIEKDPEVAYYHDPDAPKLLSSAHVLDCPEYSDEFLESTVASAEVLMYCIERTSDFEDNN